MRFGRTAAHRLGSAAVAVAAFVIAAAPAAGKGPTPPGPEFDGLPAEYASAFTAKEACSRMFVANGDLEPLMNDARIAATLLAPGFEPDLAKVTVDREDESVSVEMPGYPPRTAVRAKSQGCVILPAYSGRLHFKPTWIRWRGPSAKRQWPRGERLWHGASSIDRAALDAAMQRYMDAPGTRAIVVVHRGELVGESYAPGFGRFTPQRAWSASKSITATLAGLMVDRGEMKLDAPAPIAEWAADGRSEITLRQLLNMSSGLEQKRFDGTARSLETFTPRNGHSFIYFDGFDTYADALEAPLEVPPGSRWQYRNANVLAVADVFRHGVRSVGRDPDRFPQRELLEPLGMRTTTLETDPYGHYIASGTTYTTARDLARLGLLHLRRGRFAGRRVVSRKWVRFVRTPAPTTNGYGGFWWLNLDRQLQDVPRTAYFASGAFGQTSLVIPSHRLVIARMGFSFPEDEAMDDFAAAVVGAVERGERGERGQ